MKTEIYGEKKSDKNKQINTATAKTDQTIYNYEKIQIFYKCVIGVQ